jgi:hypothetical protein
MRNGRFRALVELDITTALAAVRGFRRSRLLLMIPTRRAGHINFAPGFFVAMKPLRERRFAGGTCYVALFQMNIGTALPAVG